MQDDDGLHGRFRMKNQNILEIVIKVFAFIRSQYAKRKADECPHVDNTVVSAIVLAQFMNLGVAVVASGNAIIGLGGLDLIILDLSEFQTIFLETRLQKSTAAATAVVVGSVGLHVDEVFLADNRLDNKTEIFRYGVAVAFAHDLAGVLNGELNAEVLVPVGVDLEFAFADPFGIVLIDIFYFKIVLEVEFVQSGPD